MVTIFQLRRVIFCRKCFGEKIGYLDLILANIDTDTIESKYGVLGTIMTQGAL